ncbi:MAG: DMT family transporter [Alphaproteobacteria bacterium]
MQRVFHSSERLRAIIYILLAAVCWSFIGPFASVAMQRGVTPLEVAFWRSLLAGSTFLILALITKQKWAYGSKDIPFILGWVVFGVALNFMAYMSAVHYLGNGLAAILLYTAPLWIMILSILIYKEYPRRIQVIALIIGFAGILAICWPHENMNITFVGLFWGLLSGLGYCFQYFFNNSRLQSQPIFFNFAIVFLGASLCLFPFVDFVPKSPLIWLSLLCLGSVATVLAYGFWSLSMRYLSPVTVSIIALLEPALATLWGVSFFGEQPNSLIYIGGILILLSALLITLSPAKPSVK